MTKSQGSVRLGLACLLALAACSSDGATTSTEPATGTNLPPPIVEPVVLASADGVVSLEVPAGVVRQGTDLGIDTVDPATVVGLDGATPIGAAYRLRPDGLRFPEPLRVMFRIAAPETGNSTGLPLVLAMIVSDGGVRAEIEGRTALADTGGGEIEHLAAIDQFGTLVLVDGGVTFDLQPAQVADLEPGDSFEAALVAGAERNSFESWPSIDLQARWGTAGAASEQGSSATETVSGFGADGTAQEWTVVNEYMCEVVGSATHSVEIRVDVSGLPGDAQTLQFVDLSGESTCGDVGR